MDNPSPPKLNSLIKVPNDHLQISHKSTSPLINSKTVPNGELPKTTVDILNHTQLQSDYQYTINLPKNYQK